MPNVLYNMLLIGYYLDFVEALCRAPYVEHADRIIQYHGYKLSTGLYSYGSKVSYTCKKNYIISGRNHLECTKSGYFAPSLPSCVSTICQPPYIHDGYLKISTKHDLLVVGTVIEYHCEDGYYLEGATENKCMKNGKWKNKKPECIDHDVFRNRCIINGKKFELRKDPTNSSIIIPYCLDESNAKNAAAQSQLNTITIVTSTAAAIFGILLLIVAIVAFQRRRILHQIRRARQECEQEDQLLDIYYDQPQVQFILPSYTEAVRSKPTFAPPTFDEAMQEASMDAETDHQNIAGSDPHEPEVSNGLQLRSDTDNIPNTVNDEMLNDSLASFLSAEDTVDNIPQNDEDAPPPYPGNSNRLTSISSDGSIICDDGTDTQQLIH